MLPSSILASLAPMASRMARSSVTYWRASSDAADVGPADDLDQRHTGPVEVDQRVAAAVDASTRSAEVSALAGVLFEVGALDADALAARQVEGSRRRSAVGRTG